MEKKQRIVVKVGTSTLTHDSGNLDLRSMEHLVRTLSDLSGMGHEIQAGPQRAAQGAAHEAGHCRRGPVPDDAFV